MGWFDSGSDQANAYDQVYHSRRRPSRRVYRRTYSMFIDLGPEHPCRRQQPGVLEPRAHCRYV